MSLHTVWTWVWNTPIPVSVFVILGLFGVLYVLVGLSAKEKR